MAIYADPRHGGAGTGGAPLADRGREVNGIRDGTERYLTIRRSLGCKLKVEGRMLGQFVGFLGERGDSRLTVQAAKHPLGSGLWPCQAGELSAAADWCPRLHPLVDHLYISMYRNK
ncbi:hypothetical protein [Streptomyces flaveus]|uniref:hypothetical protein n=1 Tax=Streptomyces flaveus TaxID=66370 RepID=UPI00331B84A9